MKPAKSVTTFARSLGLPLFALALLAACAAAESEDENKQVGPDTANATLASKTPTRSDGAPSVPEQPLIETEQLMLAQAAQACKGGDFKAFFEASLRSRPVRLRYFDASIKTSKGHTAVGDYRFPIEIMDQSFIAAGSAANGPNNWEYVTLEFNQAQDERYRVDWVRVDLGPNGDDEGATPEDDREYGARGYLLFQPTTACWTLAQEGYE